MYDRSTKWSSFKLSKKFTSFPTTASLTVALPMISSIDVSVWMRRFIVVLLSCTFLDFPNNLSCLRKTPICTSNWLSYDQNIYIVKKWLKKFYVSYLPRPPLLLSFKLMKNQVTVEPKHTTVVQCFRARSFLCDRTDFGVNAAKLQWHHHWKLDEA